MTKQERKTIEKLIKLNREMLMAEMKHAKETGIRHQPNKTYFKKLRKQKEHLKASDTATLRQILTLILDTTDELTKPEGLRRKDIDSLSRNDMKTIILNTRYLHEFLSEALDNH